MGLWQEIDYYKTYHAKCYEDMVEYNKEVDENHIFDLFSRLNSSYNGIRVQILAKEPLSPLNGVFSFVQEEEDRRHAMLSPSPVHAVEKSAFISTSQWGVWRFSWS